MKKYLFLLFLFISLSFLYAQPLPIVQVDPVVNLSDEVWLDAVCDAATDNVLFTLKFLGQFEVLSDLVVEKETGQLENLELIDQETFDTSSLKKRAESEGYDNILFGSCSIENNSYIITMNAYDLALDKITYSGSTVVESIFDTFEAVDEITYQTVEGFSGIHVTYGSLVLVPPDTGEPFSFTIDGISLPEGTFSVERMPSGVHELAVSQERPFGLYEAVHEIVVEEEIENKIDIPLPYLIESELSQLNQIEKEIYKMLIKGVPDKILDLKGFSIFHESEFIHNYRTAILHKLNYLENIFYGKGKTTIDSHELSSNLHFNSLFGMLDYGQRSTVFQNGKLSTATLKPSENLISDTNSSLFVDFRSIIVDGKSEDWNDMQDSYIDIEGEQVKSIEFFATGNDMILFNASMDSSRLYLMMETADSVYDQNRNAVYIFQLRSSPTVQIGVMPFEKRVWVNLYYSQSDIRNWVEIESHIDFAFGDIVEVSIPLADFLPYFSSLGSTQFIVGTSYMGDGWRDLDQNFGSLIFPTVKVMIIKNNEI